jgi:ubiquinone/menaquinone biosynthesis C-methylase UbiE
MDMDSYINALVAMNAIREPVIREAIQSLYLPKGSYGLDAGCGVGLQSLLLADEIGSTGHVTGLDLSEEMLQTGRLFVEEAGKSEQISFKQGTITDLPFEDSTFDWIWSSDCAGYAPLDPYDLLVEFNRVLKPGGIIAIAAWSSELLLPGYPKLEALLDATSGGIAPFTSGKDPSLHFMRALGWFNSLGFKDATTGTFARSVYAPLDDMSYKALKDLIDMRWPGAEYELSAEDAAEYERLCSPDSPDFILNLPDYHAMFTYTVYRCRTPVL